MAVAEVTKARKSQKSAVVAQLKAMQRQIQEYRQAFNQFAQKHGLAANEVDRVDEACGEIDCGLEDLLPE